ncbi:MULTISPECIES: alpha/beta fold hydrolase [Clostridium]|uniref:alpha/beta fold hydrolase n=1 Tax=Clostridium TaxID=1485 RepID=UPI000824B504|nr:MULTISPECIES: alpha/beta hydrolase [Clostridium]PJI09789.1 alpha/beta hydrolase [Clostridium sp. CT7]
MKCKRIKKIFLMIIVMTLMLNAFFTRSVSASEEGKEDGDFENYYITEKNYSKEMKGVEKYLGNIRKSGYFHGKNNLKIYYEKYVLSDSKASIVISHGFRESMVKYNETIYYFLKNGYSVYGLEHRGHARSGRLGKDSTQTSIDKFDYYVDDFKTYMDTVVIPENKGKKLFLFAHSMGGAIGGLFLERHPGYFNAAILSAPMFEINTGKYPEFFSRVTASVVNLIRCGDNYAPGKHAYSKELYSKDSCTGSKIRYDYYSRKIDNNTELQNGGPSFKWLNESLTATDEVTDEENASKVTIPVLLFQAADDNTVKPQGENKFAKSAKNCKLVVVKNSNHEIYREKDSVIIPYFHKVFKFLSSNLK